MFSNIRLFSTQNRQRKTITPSYSPSPTTGLDSRRSGFPWKAKRTNRTHDGPRDAVPQVLRASIRRKRQRIPVSGHTEATTSPAASPFGWRRARSATPRARVGAGAGGQAGASAERLPSRSW